MIKRLSAWRERRRNLRALKQMQARSTCPDMSPGNAAAAARALWEYPVFKQAVRDVMATLQDEMLHSEDQAHREGLHRQTRALAHVTERLTQYYQPTNEEE